jgi:hypothetical protein
MSDLTPEVYGDIKRCAEVAAKKINYRDKPHTNLQICVSTMEQSPSMVKHGITHARADRCLGLALSMTKRR